MTRWPRLLGMTPGEWCWLSVGVVLLAYELWAVATRGGDVLTRAMRNGLPRWTAVAFGWGVLTGHLFGPVWPAFRFAWVIPFAVLGLLLARDVFVGGRVPADAVLALLIAGVIAGTLWVGRP